jgi:hypothetical protein
MGALEGPCLHSLLRGGAGTELPPEVHPKSYPPIRCQRISARVTISSKNIRFVLVGDIVEKLWRI